MPKTAVGLFKDPKVVDEVVREIEALGFPRSEVRTLGEPLDLAVTGVMSIPHTDFETGLFRELTRIGATRQEADAYVEGLRHRGILVFATGSDDRVESAAQIMNRHGAVEIEESTGPEPSLPQVPRANMMPASGAEVQAGRIRQAGGGACFFVW
jgi:hypothetical protein